MAIEFYQEIEEPDNILTTIPPEDWTNLQYLEYQSDVRRYRLEIEEKPYTDTVSQNRAVGLNQSGIILIATNYSFASDPNILINELKFIIDRDNLKAY